MTHKKAVKLMTERFNRAAKRKSRIVAIRLADELEGPK